MRFTFPLFFGALVLLAGASILIDAIFKVHVPFVRSAFAVLLIFFGVQLLIGAWAPVVRNTSSNGSAVMSELHFAPTVAASPMKYDVIFGRGTIDLTQLPKPDQTLNVELNAIFSSATLTVDPSWPMVIEASSAFGEVRMPDQSFATFGTARYATTDAATPVLRVRINTVFGSCHVLTSAAHETKPPQKVSAVTP
jgi:hypothetical protein